MQKDFITATPDSGGSGSTTVTATASANQTESTRSTSLSVASWRSLRNFRYNYQHHWIWFRQRNC